MEENSKRFDLEERTYQFARRCRALAKVTPRTVCNRVDIDQLARASASVAANYIEANEAISKKDFIHRMKISRKEAKESRLFLRLLDLEAIPVAIEERDALIQETVELVKIFTAILSRSKPV